jgi:hypothetical protein
MKTLPLLPLLPGIGLLALIAMVSCAAPHGGENFQLAAGPVAGPGIGVGASIGQTVHEGERRRILVEAGLMHQRLDDDLDNTGRPLREGWDQATLGVRIESTATEGGRWSLRGGAVWVRAQGDPVFLDEPADYGGVYLGAGLEWRFSRHLSMGPELTLFGLLPEGSGRTGGIVPQLAWRVALRF